MYGNHHGADANGRKRAIRVHGFRKFRRLRRLIVQQLSVFLQLQVKIRIRDHHQICLCPAAFHLIQKFCLHTFTACSLPVDLHVLQLLFHNRLGHFLYHPVINGCVYRQPGRRFRRSFFPGFFCRLLFRSAAARYRQHSCQQQGNRCACIAPLHRFHSFKTPLTRLSIAFYSSY